MTPNSADFFFSFLSFSYLYNASSLHVFACLGLVYHLEEAQLEPEQEQE